MATSRRGRPRRVTGDTATPNPTESNTNDDQKKGISDYEQSREERIQENLQRMQKLGIIDLSLKLKSLKPTPRPKKVFSPRNTPIDFSGVPPSGPTRRSSRLQNVASVSYTEVELSKKDEKLENLGSRPEVYTEEDEKLLGSTEMSWTLFVDGCGNDGKRIYDPVKGKTCHQCRQKTLGHRTHCSKCGMVQGQFCGDCLYMRYGEHVLEANQNPNWICPVCRGICNCSLCHQSKGWPPTGSLYRKISSLGYKSVAHYLVQTRRAEPVTEPSSHVNSTLGEELGVDCNTTEELTDSQRGDKKPDKILDATRQEERNKSSDNDLVKSMVEPEPSSKPPREPSVKTTEAAGEICFEADESIVAKDTPVHTKLELENVSFQVNVDTSVDDRQAKVADSEEIVNEGQYLLVEGKKGTLGFRQKKKPAIFSFPGKVEEGRKSCSSLTSKEVVTSPEAKRKSSKMMTEVSPDSIAGRLRQRRCKN